MTTPSPMKSPDRDAADETVKPLRMNAYYYSFAATGIPEIDRILSAVACAGKDFHYTRDWQDDAEPWPGHAGSNPIEWIQNAANDAAKAASELATLRRRVAELEEQLAASDGLLFDEIYESMDEDTRDALLAEAVARHKARAIRSSPPTRKE